MKRFYKFVFLCLWLSGGSFSLSARQDGQYVHADSLIEAAIAKKLFPGGVLAVVKNGKVDYLKAYGNKAVMPQVEPMSLNTVFDLASVTKPFTAFSIMLLVEEGKLRLEDEVHAFLPYVPGGVKIIHLLTHTSGIPDYGNVKGFLAEHPAHDRPAFEKYIQVRCGKNPPGKVFEYSCLNYVCLQYIVEAVSGKSLQEFELERIFRPLGMVSTGFIPQGEVLARCAPTELQTDGTVLRGQVHDSLALYMNRCVSGNAGLFSDAADLILFARMLLNKGMGANGARVISPVTLQTMISVPLGYEVFGRSLGWDNYSSYASDHGSLFNRKLTYGHTGYTGPGMFIDPEQNVAVIFLAHRVHPYNKGSMVDFRAKLANILGGAL